MVLEKLGESLKGTLSKIKNAIFVDEKLINEIVKEIQRSLIQSDVNIALVQEISQSIKKKFREEKAIPGLSEKERIIKILYEELAGLMGGEAAGEPKIEKRPFKIMLVGLFGSGKTTQDAKLGNYYAKRGYKVALVSTDTWRPAAFEQLEQLGKKINLPAFGNKKEKNPLKIYESFEKQLKEFDIVIIDTAGRDALSKELIDELEKLYKKILPDEVLLVLSADIGQSAEKQARAFHETTHVTGVIITKLDGTAKGGGALSACSVTNAKVKFIGTGEKINDFEKFNPKGFVGRMLGLGDIDALLEKAKESIDEERAKDLGSKFLKGEYNLLDLYEQIEAMKKMGPLNKIIQMIPGLGGANLPKEMLDLQDQKLDEWKIIFNSMTKGELESPGELNISRIRRIAEGSGKKEEDVREIVKYYKKSKKIMKLFKGKSEKGLEKMMGNMGNMKGMKNMKF